MEAGMADQPARKQRSAIRTEVLRTQWLTPHMVRVTAGGEGLRPFVNNDFTDRYVKIVFKRPGVEYPEPFDLNEVRETMPREQAPALRTYTVRSHDPVANEIVIDFVYHGDEGLAGPWAANAKPGDEMLFIGPGGAYAPNPSAAWHLLVGDEAALPAIAAALEEIPAGVPAYVFLEVANAEEEQALPTPAKAEITWFHRDSSPLPPGEEIEAAVRAFELPNGEPHCFVHGEAGFVMPLRRFLLDRGVTKEQLSISGYWRRGKTDEGWRAEKAEINRREREAEQAAAQR
jgi:NADPH-dependent ferric siderophore reductase